MSKNVFSLERDLILGAVYISPEGSTVYNSCEKGGTGLLEEKICKIIDSYVDIMLAGDFNDFIIIMILRILFLNSAIIHPTILMIMIYPG